MEDTIRVIPQELSGDTKIGKHFYFTDAAVIVFYFGLDFGWGCGAVSDAER